MTETPTADEDWVAALASLANPPLDGAVIAPNRRYRYMVLPALLAEVRTKLGAHRWAVGQRWEVEGTELRLWTTFWHVSGAVREFGPATMSTRTSAQEIGSTLTYLRRYHLSALVGLAGDDDDDGQAASAPPRPPAPPPAPPRPPAPPEEDAPTSVPYTGHQAHLHGPTRRSTGHMWALLREQGWDQDTIRSRVAAWLGIPADWKTNELTQEQVSRVITAIEGPEEE